MNARKNGLNRLRHLIEEDEEVALFPVDDLSLHN
jgi:hypothetical protein